MEKICVRFGQKCAVFASQLLRYANGYESKCERNYVKRHPQLLHRYEQAIDLVHLDYLVVDREGMAAEFLFQLHTEGRRVVTLLRSNQYKDEGSFTEVGEWLPWRLDREGSVVCARGGSPVSTATLCAARPAVDSTGRDFFGIGGS
jgi:hypothetical protein